MYLSSDAVIQSLHSHIGPQQLQTLTVGLPEELHPGHQDGPVTPVLRPLPRHCGQHDHLRGGDVLQVVHLHTVRTLLPGSVSPLLRHAEVLVHHVREAGHVAALTHVPVLEQPLLGHVTLLQVHAQLQVPGHDLLDQLLTVGVVPLLGLDNFIQSIKSFGWFS